MRRLHLPRLRGSFLALCLATFGWAVGCATPGPLVDPSFAARTYTPARIVMLPPDVFVVYDEVGQNDPQKSQALGQAVSADVGRLMAGGLQRRGYQVSTAPGWDGIRNADGSYALSGQELGWMAGSILQFSASPVGGARGVMGAPALVAPELARKVGAAAQADALMYVNVKGVAVSPGKKAAQVAGVVFFVVILAAIVLLVVAQGKSGGHQGGSPSASPGGGGGGRTVRSVNGWRGPAPGTPQTATVAQIAAPPRGYGRVPLAPGPVYGGPNIGLGVAMVVPMDGPVHTHEGAVAEDDETFAGDQAYVSATLVSTYDGRVLWHARRSIDVALDRPADVQRMIDRLVDTIPPSLSLGAAVPPAAKH